MVEELDLVIRGGTLADGTGAALRVADIGIRGGKIVAVGDVAGTGREEIDAKGLLVTPGFVDVHTHYDGQLTWSDRLSPSSSHGVTTVVTGNCGVGFAPCREGDRDALVHLMEGVEDIPEVVMATGLPWNWESFPDFLDAIESKPHDVDFAVLLPHSPLRVFVMGERALKHEPSTAEDRARMRELARDAMLAGAAGFATSRNIYHRSTDGNFVPSMSALEDELTEIALGLADARRGNLQAINLTDSQGIDEFEFYHRVARAAGRPLSYTLLHMDNHPNLWREVLASIASENGQGGQVKAQVFNRPGGQVFSLDTKYHPFANHPYYVERLAGLPLAARVAEMGKPEVRARLLQEDGDPGRTVPRFECMFPLGDPPDYEPAASKSIASQAAVRGVSPLELVYDELLVREGTAAFLMAATGYVEGNLDTMLDIMKSKDTVLGLGDGGAHYGLICDASYTTYHLTHWARDRSRGARMDVAEAVRMLTSEPADLYGFRDRGRLLPGMKADVNIIDFDRLTLRAPEVVSDLPAGGRRLHQRAEGYVTTLVNGVAIQREGQDTGARPGRLVRNAGV